MQIWLLVAAFIIVVFAYLWRKAEQERFRLEDELRGELYQGNEELKAARSRCKALEAAASTADELLLILNDDLEVVFSNKAAEEVFGKLGVSTTLIAYAHSLELETLVKEAREGCQGEVFEQGLHIKDVPYNTRVLACPGLIGVSLTNASELRRLSRARQDFITNLSHEIRTPLTSIRLIADTMRSPAGADPEINRSLTTKMVHEVDELNQMAEEMLELAAIESGRQVVRLVPVDLWDLISSPLERMHEQATVKGLDFEKDLPDGVQVLADREHAGRAIVNVLHNAVKFSPEGGRIMLGAEVDREDERVVLKISDEGTGIPPHELKRIFERFYRSEEARHTPGTGLGLAIARHIMNAHGGEIWAANRPLPDRGTTLFLAFQMANNRIAENR